MVTALIKIIMAINIKGNGKIMLNKALEFMNGKMGKFIMENGKMIKWRDKEKLFI